MSIPNQPMQEILDALAIEDAELCDPTTLSPEQGRAMAAQANQRWNIDLPELERVDHFSFEGDTGHPIEAQLFSPLQREHGLIVFIHGGGFAFCDTSTHERFIRLLAIESQCAVLSVDYRLAPEHPYPAGLDDCVSACEQLSTIYSRCPWTQGPLALAGDSAGANLVLATLLRQQDKPAPHAPGFALLFYGVFGTDFDTPSYLQFADGPGLSRYKMQRYIGWYAEAEQYSEPWVSPLLASDAALKRLPPLYFNAAEIDPLRSDSEMLVARLQSLGRDEQLDTVPGVVHGFLQMTQRLDVACSATAEAGKAYRKFAHNTH